MKEPGNAKRSERKIVKEHGDTRRGKKNHPLTDEKLTTPRFQGDLEAG